MASNKKKITLYLSPWQSRMVSDFMPRRKTKWAKVTISLEPVQCPASYKIKTIGLSKKDWIFYLTDEQIAIIKEGFNLKTAISSINITENLLKNKEVVFK